MGSENDYLNSCLLKAEQGDSDAQYNLGYMYYNGEGVVQDYKEAVKWYRKAAEQGDSDAQLGLGNKYYNGQGVRKDYKEAVKWYRKAAEQGDSSAQYNLGVMYDNGEGVSKDYKEAVKWYTKAAEQGHSDAQYNLDAMHENNKVIPNNLGGHIFPKAVCSCMGFSEDNLVLAIKQGRLGWFFNWGPGLSLLQAGMILITGGIWLLLLLMWYFEDIVAPPLVCHLCGSKIENSQLRG